MKQLWAGVTNQFLARFYLGALLLALPLALAQATPAWAQQAADANDPLEDINRRVFQFNRAADTLFIGPAAGFYRALVPPPAQTGVRNVLHNLASPVTMINDLLQGNVDRAGITFKRFALNSTVGVLGLFDVAKDYGLPRHSEDFGQTLASWGVGDGPYLVLPLLGPSNPRDAVGLFVDSYIDPYDSWANNTHRSRARIARMGLNVVVKRADLYNVLDGVYATSVDPYATLRSLYWQHRNTEIHDGYPPAQNKFSNLSGAYGDAPAPD